MLRLLALLALLAAPAAGSEAVRFVFPVDGAPAAGEQWIELEAAAEFERIEVRVDGELTGILREAPLRVRFDFGDGLRPRRVTADVYTPGFTSRDRAEVVTSPFDPAAAMTVDWVEVPVRVRGRIDPRPSSFRVFENDEERVVEEVVPERKPSRFVFVVDRSQSMSGGRLDAAMDAIRDVASRLRDGDSAEVIFFNHRVTRPVALASVAIPETTGGTALRDALAEIAPSSRTIAIVVSDGDDRNSLLDAATALRRVAVDDLTVHAVLLGRGSAAPFVRQAAERTGGTVTITGTGGLKKALGRLFDEIDGRWTVAYQSAGEHAGWRSIEIETTTRGAAVVAARKGYFAE